MGEVLELQIAATETDVVRAMGEVSTFLENRDVTPAIAYPVQLAFEELGTNIMKYGGADGFAARLDLGPPAVLVLEDSGHPFDPWTDAPAPDLDLPVEDRAIGGLGLHMVRQMAATVGYERRGDRNVVTVTFKTEDAR